MVKPVLTKKSSVYFIGIGGISMSGIAELFLDRGHEVAGSDLVKTAVTEHLEDLGIKVFYTQEEGNIPDGTDLVVYTAAVHEDNPEYMEAERRGIPMLDRAECLGQIMKNFENAVAVAGTHGKTTTTSMLSYVYLAADLDPTISVGGILPGIGGNMRLGKSPHFIMEACEYADSFLKFAPTAAIVLNIEAEHLDFFADLEDERQSFKEFIDLLPEGGLLILHEGIERKEELTEKKGLRIVTYGLPGTGTPDYTAKNITYNEKGHASYDFYKNDAFLHRVELSVTGEHNVLNSLAVLAASLEPSPGKEPLSLSAVLRGIKNYTGTDRRFQYKGMRNGFTVVDDYAHHPTEILATLTAARKVKHEHLVIAFQPHLYSRTKLLLPDFIEVLKDADTVVLADIYAAREEDPGDITSEALLTGLKERGTDAYYFKSFSEIENFLIHNCLPGDLLITMGAGDIFKVGEHLVNP